MHTAALGENFRCWRAGAAILVRVAFDRASPVQAFGMGISSVCFGNAAWGQKSWTQSYYLLCCRRALFKLKLFERDPSQMCAAMTTTRTTQHTDLSLRDEKRYTAVMVENSLGKIARCAAAAVSTWWTYECRSGDEQM